MVMKFFIQTGSPKKGELLCVLTKTLTVQSVKNMTLVGKEVFECITVEIALQKRRNIVESCVYRAPGSDMNLFEDWVEKIFTINTRKDVIICGDHNVDILKAKKKNINSPKNLLIQCLL